MKIVIKLDFYKKKIVNICKVKLKCCRKSKHQLAGTYRLYSNQIIRQSIVLEKNIITKVQLLEKLRHSLTQEPIINKNSLLFTS